MIPRMVFHMEQNSFYWVLHLLRLYITLPGRLHHKGEFAAREEVVKGQSQIARPRHTVKCNRCNLALQLPPICVLQLQCSATSYCIHILSATRMGSGYNNQAQKYCKTWASDKREGAYNEAYFVSKNVWLMRCNSMRSTRPLQTTTFQISDLHGWLVLFLQQLWGLVNRRCNYKPQRGYKMVVHREFSMLEERYTCGGVSDVEPRPHPAGSLGLCCVRFFPTFCMLFHRLGESPADPVLLCSCSQISAFWTLTSLFAQILLLQDSGGRAFKRTCSSVMTQSWRWQHISIEGKVWLNEQQLFAYTHAV